MRLGEKAQFELVILTSFPGSGNTWTRLLLENASGYYTVEGPTQVTQVTPTCRKLCYHEHRV